MGTEPPESNQPVLGGTVREKPAASVVADPTTKEEQAEQDAKLRPEREAAFGDYLVSTASTSGYEAVTNCKTASLQVCSGLGSPSPCRRRGGSCWIRSRMSKYPGSPSILRI